MLGMRCQLSQAVWAAHACRRHHGSPTPNIMRLESSDGFPCQCSKIWIFCDMGVVQDLDMHFLLELYP